MRKKSSGFVAFLLGFVVFAVSACVDNDYDLNEDLDLTIAVGGSEFAIPGGMTEEIKLSKVLKLENDDVIRIDEEGNYFLFQKGDPTSSKISVKGFDIGSPTIKPTEKILDFKKVVASTRAISETYTAIVPIDEKPAAFTLEENDLPKEIQSVSFITVDLDVKIHFSYTTGVVSKIKMNEVIVHMPKFFVSKELEGTKYYIRDRDIAENTDNEVTVHIEGFDCSKLSPGQGIDGALHKLFIEGEFNMEGTFSANSADFQLGAATTGIKLEANYTLANIKVNKIKGIVKPEIDMDIKPVNIDNLPDFLSDDEVRLDVKNPMIFLSLNNQTPVETGITGNLSSYKNDQQLAGPVPVTINPINPNQDQVFCLSPEGTTDTGVRSIKVPGLTQLIEKIPDEIRFDVDVAATNKEVEVELNKEYTINTGYSLNVPFVFGPNLSIVYKDTIDGWQDDLEDYEIKTIHVTSKVANRIPLALVFTAEAITTDAINGHVALNDVSIKVKANGNENDNTIKAGNAQGVETPIVIEIKELKEGAIKKLDGLILRAVAKSGQSNEVNRLNENQTIQLKEIKLKVPGGLKVNLN